MDQPSVLFNFSMKFISFAVVVPAPAGSGVDVIVE
jgi:hypothetical protein